MNVLSLFDGMSCGMLALDRLGIKVDKYYASEIDKYAIQVSQANYPDIIQVGDITKLDLSTLPKIDLVMGGSPCQGFSFAGKQLAFDDPRSALFFKFVKCVDALKPKYFLLENVKMKKEYLDIISEHMGVEPIFINSSLVSAQSRQRYYWTNIPNVEQPKERGIVLRDILEDGFDTERDKSHCLDVNYYKGSSVENYLKKSRRQMVFKDSGNNGMILVPQKLVDDTNDLPEKSQTIKSQYYKSSKANFEREGTFHATGIPQKLVSDKPQHIGTAVDIKAAAWRGRYNEDGSTSQKLELRKDEKSNAITTVQKDSFVVQSYREVRTEEAKKARKENRQKTGKDHTPFRAKELQPRDDGKVGTVTPSLNNDHKISLTKNNDQEVYWRKLTPLECERLQTVPDNYTNHVSNTQRYKMLGNGWTIEVIAHILKNMEVKNEW